MSDDNPMRGSEEQNSSDGDWSEDIPEAVWLAAASTNPVFDFMDSPAEDVYAQDDEAAG